MICRINGFKCFLPSWNKVYNNSVSLNPFWCLSLWLSVTAMVIWSITKMSFCQDAWGPPLPSPVTLPMPSCLQFSVCSFLTNAQVCFVIVFVFFISFRQTLLAPSPCLHRCFMREHCQMRCRPVLKEKDIFFHAAPTLPRSSLLWLMRFSC